MLMSMSGTTLAVTGMSGSGSAGTAQYLTPQTNPAPGDEGTTTPDTGTVLGSKPGGGNPQTDTQARVTQDAASLPFTGFLAIPLLLGGAALLSVGLFLRRRASDGEGPIAP